MMEIFLIFGKINWMEIMQIISNNKFIPSVWNDFISMRWCYDERELGEELCVERETELYELKRDYDEWKEMLEVYLNKNDLIYNKKVTDPILNIIINGDWTEINLSLIHI